MEMELDQLNETDISEKINGVSGEPKMRTRVGEEYQAQIPPMTLDSEFLGPSTESSESSDSFLIGLPIKVMWVHDGVERNDNNEILETGDMVTENVSLKSYRRKKKTHSSLTNVTSKLNSEPLDYKKVEKPAKAELPSKTKFLVPGSSSNPWEDADVDGFLLGLYIFGKNFFQVKSFLEKKEIGEILCYYYGKFYRSDKYRRWSECRKEKCKKYIRGRRIFTGKRLQRFLSRLHPYIPKELQTSLPEVSMSFADGTTSLEDYVSYLKNIVGIRALIEAIGVGKGREDLTGLAIDPAKTYQEKSITAAVRTGKNCGSLTSGEIVKLLTGNFRLSKARSNDIFWDAVWPRLLARGWHSEQPKYQDYLGSKDRLVFLMPGIDKFSRRELVKAVHYFDSVNGVLKKVASEPELLQLETEDDMQALQLQPQSDSAIRQPQRYLKPRLPKLNYVKFTVVDSSFPEGEEPRYSPLGLKMISKITSTSREIEGEIPEHLVRKCKSVGVKSSGERMVGNAKKGDVSPDLAETNCMRFTIVDTSLIQGEKRSKVSGLRVLPVEFEASNDISYLSSNDEEEFLKCSRDRKLHEQPCKAADDRSLNETGSSLAEVDPSQRYLSKRVIKHQFSRRVKSGHSNELGPPIKRRRLTACAAASCAVEEEISCKTQTTSCNSNLTNEGKSITAKYNADEDESRSNSSNVKISNEENKHCQSKSLADLDEEKKLPPCENEENLDSIASLAAVCSEEEVPDMKPKCESESNFDLNEEKKLSLCKNEENLNTTTGSGNFSCEDQEADMKPTRQSRRSRPLTTRALEAIECGFLNVVKVRQKRTKACKRDFLSASPSRRARSKVKSKHGKSGNIVVKLKEENEVASLVMDDEDSNHLTNQADVQQC